MAEKPNTISDAEWRRLQEAAAEATGGLIPKTDAQRRTAANWTNQRDNADKN